VVVIERADGTVTPAARPKPSTLRRHLALEQAEAAAADTGASSDGGVQPQQQQRRRQRRRRHGGGGQPASDLPTAAVVDEHVLRVLTEAPRLRTDRSIPRAYVAQLPVPDPDLDDAVAGLLGDLLRFQARQALRKPTMAKARRRVVLGLRQALRAAKHGPLPMVVLARNLEPYGICTHRERHTHTRAHVARAS
jgi:hypothetical protein